MTNADHNLEPRVEAVEIDMQELKSTVANLADIARIHAREHSDLKSTVATLADIVGIHEQQHQDSMRRMRSRCDGMKSQRGRQMPIAP
ncbi:MAG: hypothetical protein HC769_25495 [Cyanobacteria bacterium CRU_2_1]|nr:hypothetical protein [Cyanobacteria bacterium CRU_2_1]